MDAFITIITKKFDNKNKENEYYYVTDITEQQRLTFQRTHFQNFYCSNTAAAEFIMYNTMYKFSKNFDYKISSDLNHPQWNNIHKVNLDLSNNFHKDLKFTFHYIEVE